MFYVGLNTGLANHLADGNLLYTDNFRSGTVLLALTVRPGLLSNNGSSAKYLSSTELLKHKYVLTVN